MSRFKRHKVKCEKPETSSSHGAVPNDYDLTYYIHDRVELMHQVFSVLRHKDLKAMAPECVRHISIDDLQELCTEELLGISSKRLCAILDGAEPPSDTESSSESPERLETISLDSISSDDEILSVASSKKNKKHKRHHRDSRSKSKKNKKTKESPEGSGAEEQSRATRAGLTVLELLELQARARAIRAQLQKEQAAKQGTATETEAVASSHHSSDNEVEIKEEPAEVVEISSEDEKPNIEDLREKSSSIKDQPLPDSQSVTKRINDLIITVPQTKHARKIKLNRPKTTVSLSKSDKAVNVNVNNADTSTESVKSDAVKSDAVKNNGKDNIANTAKSIDKETQSKLTVKSKEKQKKKHKRKGKKKEEEKDSDHDEITLQLSDTEKMDLLEDLDRKNFENVSSSGSEDSESSSSDSSSDDELKDDRKDKRDTAKSVIANKKKTKKSGRKASDLNKTDNSVEEVPVEKINDANDSQTEKDKPKEPLVESSNKVPSPMRPDVESIIPNEDRSQDDTNKSNEVTESSQDIEISESKDNSDQVTKSTVTTDENNDGEEKKSPEKSVEVVNIDDIPILEDDPCTKPESPIKDVVKDNGGDVRESQVDLEKEDQKTAAEKDLSDGEISERASSDVEAFELKPEVVCISDTEETDKKKKKAEKKKKKKEKKSKKSKKAKSDFRENADQNFFEEDERIGMTKADNTQVSKNVDKSENITETVTIEDDIEILDEKPDSLPEVVVKSEDTISNSTVTLDGDNDNDNVYETLELSDDSSCYEVEGTVISKEPTAEEIEALSVKIDEIEREDVVTEEEIREHERRLEKGADSGEVENISWKDRYLDSSKVKRVLSTSSIFNALRKKNRELKKKLEESKKEEMAQQASQELVEEKEAELDPTVEDGSIDQYNTLQRSIKNFASEPEMTETTADKEKASNAAAESKEIERTDAASNGTETNKETPRMVQEMRNDAKQLLRMYKKLLKYNDLYKKKDPNKKKKKKSKKKIKDGGQAASST